MEGHLKCPYCLYKLKKKSICCLIAAGFIPREYFVRYLWEPVVFRSLYYIPSSLQVQFLFLCLCFLHFFFFFVIIWLHRAASCHALHASSLFFLSSCIMPSVSGSSCRPQCTALLKWGLNEGGAQIIWKQRKTRHLKGPRKERVMNQSGLSELLKREFSVLKQKEHMDTKENLRRDSQ